MIRTFLAFELPFEIRQQIILFRDSIKNYSAHKIKWVEDENLHITLQFIGDIKENDLLDLSEIFRDIYQPIGKITFKYEKQELVPGRNPRIIWLKFETDSKTIYKTSHNLRNALFEKGYKVDKKPLKFHITLGRIKKELDFDEINSFLHTDFELSDFTINHVTFFKSTLTPSGAIYKVIEKYKLKI